MRSRSGASIPTFASGETHEPILADYPYLEREDIFAALQYAARRFDHPTLAA
jgi:uncharacterized protein (DUF433 family)